jgi:hypothetical protein
MDRYTRLSRICLVIIFAEILVIDAIVLFLIPSEKVYEVGLIIAMFYLYLALITIIAAWSFRR